MNAAILFIALALPGECEDCQQGYGAAARSGRPAPAAVNCRQYTPPVRWFCKPCAGCAGGTCLSCQQPFYGSAPYNYRVQFDYPWSQKPAYPYGMSSYPGQSEPGEEVILEPLPMSRRKVSAPR